jgi:uncharacterized repeat protein (TIGR01451 family)
MKTYNFCAWILRWSRAPRLRDVCSTGTRLLLAAVALALWFAGCPSKKFTIINGETPVEDKVTPATLPAGSPDTPVTIDASNLVSPVPMAGDVPLPIVSITPTQINTILPASMLMTAGSFPITVVNVTPGRNFFSNPLTFTVTTGSATGPTLALSKTHAGNFTQGQIGATYTVTTSNAGSGPTDGTPVTVTDMIPSGLTITGMNGTGWGCTAPPQCTRTDVLAAGSSYPPITVTVNVATNAPATVTNQVTGTGGGFAAIATASDPTTINGPAAPQLALNASSMPATFAPNGTGAYMATVSNTGNAPTFGTVSLQIAPSSALTPASLSGTGWACNLTTLTCTNSTPLAAGASYNVINFDVVISPSPPPTVMTSFTASGGGSSAVTTSVSNPT